MNNKGQSLVTFVLILPIIVFFLAFFIDSIYGIMEKNRLEGIISDNLEIVLKEDIKDEEEIINVLKENDKDMIIKLDIIDDDIKLNVKSNKKNIFGKIFNHQEYNLEFNYCGNYQDKKINNCKQ